MPKPYDDAMKKLVGGSPQDFLDLVSDGARFVRELPGELRFENTHADGLIEGIQDGEPLLVHLEFQSSYDLRIGERMLEYNVLASRQYSYLPVHSCVIYLKDCGHVPQSPYIRHLPSGKETVRFDYASIELHKITAEELTQKGLVGLAALLPLTKDGARREVIEDMIAKLIKAEKTDALWIGYALAAKVMLDDLHWLRKRFAVFNDFLRDLPVYQEVLEEGVEKGELQAQRQILRDIVQERFPGLDSLAKGQGAATGDTELLRRIIVKISVAQTTREAEQYLLALTRDDKRN